MSIGCDEPFGIPNALAHYTSLNWGSEAVYRCIPGYNIVRSLGIICQRNGLWTRRPRCRRGMYNWLILTFFVLILISETLLMLDHHR